MQIIALGYVVLNIRTDFLSCVYLSHKQYSTCIHTTGENENPVHGWAVGVAARWGNLNPGQVLIGLFEDLNLRSGNNPLSMLNVQLDGLV